MHKIFTTFLIQLVSTGLLAQIDENLVHHIRPAWSFDGAYIAYLSNESGTFQLHVSNFAQRNSNQITNTQQPVTLLKWSPIELRILFKSGSELFTINFDGSDLKQVHSTNNSTFFFDWHPDGNKFIYSCSLADICVKELLNESISNLTSDEYFNRNFTMSGDSILIFGSKRDKSVQLFQLNIATGKTKQLTELPFNTIDPIFSPDGQYLTFISDKDGKNKNFNVYTMRNDGKEIQLVYDLNGYNLPVWFPNSKRLLINSNENGDWEMKAVDLDGSNVRKLGSGLGFFISPKGDKILTQYTDHQSSEIHVMDMDGSRENLSQSLKK